MRFPTEPLLVLACLLAGCSTAPPDDADHGRRQMWVGDTIRSASIRRAIVSQRTIYPYHFVTGAAALNDLGRRDLGFLAEHYVEHGGVLNVSRGDASLELYAARRNAVAAALLEEGVEEGRVELVDGYPGGEGISGRRAAEIAGPEQGSSAGTTTTSDTARGDSR